ncbi:MAG TPA: ferritin-like domain-containing protein [Stellaceae bacterium]|jgi:rubrerythrin|nr:ferritin-like domain-containing protein [Stellaceae bacterium]
MTAWTLDDIPWGLFDLEKVDREYLPIIKAASVLERNGARYAEYLCSVFHDDRAFCEAAAHWAVEEIQHGNALGRWAMLADPGFDHSAACTRFAQGFPIETHATASVRGSRAGELVARCIVETATSSYYTAVADASDEPVLRTICRHIAADEFRHYKLFYSHLRRYLGSEAMGRWRRLKVALDRIAESEDDELAFAYYAANGGDQPYEHARFSAAYARRAYGVYRPHHIMRGTAMIFKAAGLSPQGWLNPWVARMAWWGMHRRVERLRKEAA